MPTHIRSAVTVAFIHLVAACAGSDAPPVTVNGVTRGTRGETTFVHTARDGVWGPMHDAVEIKRIAESSPETTFGAVQHMDATPDGGVILLDSRAAEGMIIRQFDAEGHFVRNIGRQGSGPGEYSSQGQTSFAVHTDGTLIVRDGGRAISRFSPDGTHLNTFSTGQGRGSTMEIYAATDGSLYERAPFPTGRNAGSDVIPPILHRAPDGRILDSIIPRRAWLTAPPKSNYDPREAWAPMPDGRIIHVRSDRFGFLIVDARRKTLPFIAEADPAPVPYLDEERAELKAIDEWRQRNFPPEATREMRDVPRVKLPIKSAVGVDLDGRIWLRRSAVAQKIPPRIAARSGNETITRTFDEPPVLAAFQQDGTFLGEVRFPIGAFMSFVGNIAWAIVPDANGVPKLVKYRIAER